MVGVKQVVFASMLGLASLAHSQQYLPPEAPFTSEVKTQWDTQGEYFGAIDGAGNLGAWLVAQGGTSFNVVFLPGGLLAIPGQPAGGWTGSKITGTGSAASLAGGGYKASVTGEAGAKVMKGTTPDGKAFTLNKVDRKSPTHGLVPKADWKAEYWFRENNTEDLTKWDPRPEKPQLKFGGGLYRGVTSKIEHGTTYIHIEAKSNFCPSCREQGRGNSGIYLRSQHEMQVLDSFGLNGENYEAGGIYNVKKPITNAALPPLTWQTYDCYYTYRGGTSGTFTVYLNGVLVQDKTEANNTITPAGFAGSSLYLQDHGNDVIFRNIWAIKDASITSFPFEQVLAYAAPSVNIAIGSTKIQKNEKVFLVIPKGISVDGRLHSSLTKYSSRIIRF